MKKVFGLLIFCVLLNACNPEIKEGETKRYFDLKGLIETQIKTLNTKKPFVQKTILMSEKSESHLVNTIDWAKELELFIQMDLNKPAFIQSYQVDSSSTSVNYKLKDNEKLPAIQPNFFVRSRCNTTSRSSNKPCLPISGIIPKSKPWKTALSVSS